MKTAITLLSALLLLTGCGTMEHGQKIDQSNVNQIKKGETARAELEKLLGPPTFAVLMPDGRRRLTYTYTGSQDKAGSGFLNAARFIPMMGPATMAATGAATVAGASNAGKTIQRQTLQIILTKDGIVEDYEFSDQTTDVSATPFSGKATTTNTEAK